MYKFLHIFVEPMAMVQAISISFSFLDKILILEMNYYYDHTIGESWGGLKYKPTIQCIAYYEMWYKLNSSK